MRRVTLMALLLRLARPLRHATTRRQPTRLYGQDVRPGADYVPLTPEELIPKSPEMVARATRVKEEHPERFVTPADAAEMLRKGAALVDVRTEQQVLEHEVREGVPALTAKNARRIALDNWVIAGGPPPMLGGGGRIVVCTCTAGPKSALAVEYLLQFGVDAVAVAGGLKGWDAGGLELVDAFEEDDDDEDEDEDELPPHPNAWPPGRRTRDLDANRGHATDCGQPRRHRGEPKPGTLALAKEAEAVARCQELIGEEPIHDPLKNFRNQQSTIGLSKKAMTAKTHRTHKDVDPGTQSLIDRIADDSSLKAPPMPKRPNLKSGTTKSKLQALSRYIHTFEYNHTGKNYFKMSRDRGLKHVHFTAREIIREALPIQCVEAVFLAGHLTAELDCLDLRVPLSFKSKCGEAHYRHIVLAVRDASTGKWGSLGISRRKVLAFKEPTFESLSTLVLDFQLSYKQCDHDLVKIYLGLPFPSGLHSVDPIKWRVLKQELTDEWAKKVDKYSKDCNWVREYHLSTGGLPEPYNGTTKEPKAAVPKNKKRRRKKKKKKAPDEPADEEYDPEKYAEEGDEVLGSDSEDESGCESDGAVVASDGES